MELKKSGAVVQLISHAQVVGACVEEGSDNDDLDLGNGSNLLSELSRV